MATTPKSSYRYPVTGSAPNIPQDIQNLATDLDSNGPEYATTGARDAANPTPATGDTCRVAGQIKVYRAGAWNTAVDSGSFPWVALGPPFAGGWSAVAAGVHMFRYRLFAGKVEFDGTMTYVGTITTAGVVIISTGISQIVNALDANAAAYTMIPCGHSVSGVATAATFLNPLTDGRLKIMTTSSITNPVISLAGCSMADVSVG